MSLIFHSPSFKHMDAIPFRHTCEGENISPQLVWSGLPAGTKSTALIVDDPDAPDPDAPSMTWVHWVLYNIPSDAKGLIENIQAKGLLPGIIQGLNDWQRVGYEGPCPPKGRHRYFFKLYALDKFLDDVGHATKKVLEKAMQGHVIGQAELIGTYQRSQ